MKRLTDTCNWLTGSGIIKDLTTNFDVPWKESIDGQTLDDDYYGNHSGNKPISNLAEKLLDSNGKLDATSTRRLAQIIYDKYNNNWAKVWEALLAEYNPLDNYNMVENETPAETTKTTTPAETTITTTPAETTMTSKPAETTETETPYEYTDTETPAETTETETKEDLNVGLLNSGIVSEDTKSFPTTRLTTTKEVGQKEDKLTFTNRKDTLEKSGTAENTRDYGEGYITETKEWAKSYTQNRIRPFNSNDDVITDDSETLDGVGNNPSGGGGGTPSGPTGSDNNGSYKKETGGYSDTESFTDYKEDNSKTGDETHTIKTTGLNGQNEYKTEVEESGTEKNEHKEKDYTKWQTEKKYTTNHNKILTRDIDTAGTNKLEVDVAGTDILTVQKSGTTKQETDEAETEVITVQNERTLTRQGNIGVTTNQQMLTQELEFRLMYNMFDSVVYPNIDNVLCQQFYSDEENNLY